MPRPTFDRDLQRLIDDVIILGSMAEKAVLQSVDMLVARDIEGSHRLIAQDILINRKRFAIELDTLVVIATQQPMASDLRMLAAILELATELERIGDYGKGIARITVMMGEEPPIKQLIDIPIMADKATDMLRRALDAFVRRDVDTARQIPLEDDELDGLYNRVYNELIQIIIRDPQTINQATHLLWVAHNLERAGDRVTNICERVIFTVTGEMREMDMEEPQTPGGF